MGVLMDPALPVVVLIRHLIGCPCFLRAYSSVTGAMTALAQCLSDVQLPGSCVLAARLSSHTEPTCMFLAHAQQTGGSTFVPSW